MARRGLNKELKKKKKKKKNLEQTYHQSELLIGSVRGLDRER